MDVDQDVFYLMEKRLSGVAPAECVALALRASLRALPMVMLYSSTPHKIPIPIKPFGFWPDSEVKHNLLALLVAQGLSIFLKFDRSCAAEYAAELEPALERPKAFFNGSSSLDSACSAARSSIHMFSYARGWAYLASTLAAKGAVASSYLGLGCAENLHWRGVHIAENAKIIKQYATDADTMYSQLVITANACKENNLKEEKALVTAYVVNQARFLSQRFGQYTDIIVNELTHSKNESINRFLNAAKDASYAFHLCCDETLTFDDHKLIATFEDALAAAERYEEARVAALSFIINVNVDFFLEAPKDTFETLRILLLDQERFIASINKCLACAKKIADEFVTATQDPKESDVEQVFEAYNHAYHEFDNAYGFAVNLTDSKLSTALSAIYYFSNMDKVRDIRAASINAFDPDIYYQSINTIAYAGTACCADVAAYSKYDTKDIRAVFINSVLNDLDFLNLHSTQRLFTCRLWSPALPEQTQEQQPSLQQPYSNAENLWQILWGDFKRDALVVNPDLRGWLNWYDGLFSRGVMNVPALKALIEASYTQLHEPVEDDKHDL